MVARVLAMTLCPCLSVTSRCSIETDGQDNLVFGMGASFDQSNTVFKDIQLSPKIRVLPSGSLFQTLGIENFVMAYRSSNVLSS